MDGILWAVIIWIAYDVIFGGSPETERLAEAVDHLSVQVRDLRAVLNEAVYRD
jgi:hypothetical protein